MCSVSVLICSKGVLRTDGLLVCSQRTCVRTAAGVSPSSPICAGITGRARDRDHCLQRPRMPDVLFGGSENRYALRRGFRAGERINVPFCRSKGLRPNTKCLRGSLRAPGLLSGACQTVSEHGVNQTLLIREISFGGGSEDSH